LNGILDPGSRITLIGMATNVLLTAVKGVGGWYVFTNSASLIADAAHSLSDLISDFVTLFTFKMARRPADRKYPFGYGRFEPLGTLGVSFFLIAASVGIGQHSFELLYQMLPGLSDSLGQTLPRAFPPEVVESLKTHIMQIMVYIGNHIPEHHHEAAIPIHSSALWFAAVSVVAKELLYQSTMSVARKLNSQVLVANAWHHRSDAYSSIIAAAAILGAQLGVPILDPLGGMVVAAILIKNGCSIGWEAMQELVDRSALSSTQITKQVEQLL
ncbi:hypothetical protein BJ085DRAFT_7600, partial [Dimargaris cristalligena]